MYSLTQLGWCKLFDSRLDDTHSIGLKPARVAGEERGRYRLWAEAGEGWGELSGRQRYEADSRADLPVVGDWVMANFDLTVHRRDAEDAEKTQGPTRSVFQAIIHRVLPRRTKFSRKIAGKTTEEQIVAANVDTVLLVSSLNAEFNLRRIERYLVLAWESGARPMVVLNKADLCDDPLPWILETESSAMGVPVFVTSALGGDGMEELAACLRGAGTTAFLGSSGVGKSTLINSLLGKDRLRVAAIREDDAHGRHTTTSRQMLLLPGGGILIDTPGMRELQLWDAEEGLQHAFPDIESLAQHCRFSDCHHQTEPGCEVLSAVSAGTLDEGRLQSFRKLQREEEFLRSKQDVWARQERDRRIRNIMKEQKRIYRDRKPW
ncbi:MAG: ribosome small subunit-dependent GTPase A [Acidobacteriia bacterium]|nr:ribosome small subunit-dependent GTPase A [Terriglobia bacterium]